MRNSDDREREIERERDRERESALQQTDDKSRISQVVLHRRASRRHVFHTHQLQHSDHHMILIQLIPSLPLQKLVYFPKTKSAIFKKNIHRFSIISFKYIVL